MTEWFEDETFWVKLYPFIFPEQKFAIADDQVASILKLVSLEGGNVLDLACGPGRHATALAQKGFLVTGVDLSSVLLRTARDRAHAENVDIEWIQEDMRRFVRPNAFDLAINIFTAFGYFDNKRDDLTVLRNIHQSLRKGGVFVIDTLGKECLAQGFLPTSSEELPDGKLLVERHEIFDDWTRIRNEWIVIESGQATTFRFHNTVYSGQELKDRMLQIGFDDVKLFGGLDGSEYGLNARRLVAVARK